MITWMQRHKKWLIITIWISTIAFVGAGFVGWGQYSYGDKAGAVAKVGSIEVTKGQLQKTYSNLYAQYSKMFQGNFDEEKAKSFGLQSQALNQLTQQALILNLAKSYDLEISDNELLNEIKTQEYFFDNGTFSKDIYKQVLSRNNLSIKEYEEDVKRELLIKKVLKLLPVEATENELKIIDTIAAIADKISYKVLRSEDINIDTSDEKVKVGVPSFILWFVFFSVIASLGWLPKEIETGIATVSHYITLIAMSAIGLMIHFGTIVKTAGTAFKVSSILFALQLIFSAFLISML